MQVLSNARYLARVLGTRTILFNSNHRFLSSLNQINSSPISSCQCQLHTDASSGMRGGSYFPMQQHPTMSRTCFSTEAGSANSNPTEAVKKLYDNMLQSVNIKRTMPPNASLWSMIETAKIMRILSFCSMFCRISEDFNYRTFRFIPILTAVSAKKLLGHVLV